MKARRAYKERKRLKEEDMKMRGREKREKKRLRSIVWLCRLTL